MSERDIPRDVECSLSAGECYHSRKKVVELEKNLKEIDEKQTERLNQVEKDLGNRIKSLEEKSDERDKTIEDKISDLDKHFSVIFEKNNTLIEGMTDMLGEVKDSYKTIGGKLQDVTSKVESMQKDVTRIDANLGSFEVNTNENLHHVSQEIHAVEKEVHDVDNKGKMDVVEIMRDQTKSKIAPYLVAGGAGAGILGLIVALFQHFAG